MPRTLFPLGVGKRPRVVGTNKEIIDRKRAVGGDYAAWLSVVRSKFQGKRSSAPLPDERNRFGVALKFVGAIARLVAFGVGGRGDRLLPVSLQQADLTTLGGCLGEFQSS